MKKFLLVITCLWLVRPIGAQTPAFIRDSLDAYITQGMKDWNLPGLALVIVKDGQVIVKKGYGVRDITTNQPVNDQTLFLIASNSKLFTGTVLAHLEDQHRLSLNDKVSKYFPRFRLYDSLQQYVLRQYSLLESFYRFKKRYEFILVPLSAAICVVIIFKLFVPGGVLAHPISAVVTFICTIIPYVWAIRSENKINFEQPLNHLRQILDEFDADVKEK